MQSTTGTYKDIVYHLTRSGRRKTISIYVERDGSVSIQAPDNLPQSQLEAIIERRRVWIYKHLAEWRTLNAAAVEREYVNGEGFLYLGRTYRLQWVDEQHVPLLLKGGYFSLRRDEKSLADPAGVFKTFYRDKGRVKLAQRVAHYTPYLGVEVAGVRVMELQHRWGSCSPDGSINFHWRCMMAPLPMIDYVVVHELAHLRVADHSDAFWHEVGKVLPNYRDRQRWLRENGAGLGV